MKRLFTVLLCITIAILFSSCSKASHASSSETTSILSTAETSSTEISSTEDSTSEEPSSTESSPSLKDESSSGSSKSPTSSTSSSGGLSWGENKVFHPISGLPFKDRANPETGLSWDGVSPIIYTYPDGTTGTEPRDGATCEVYPGKTSTFKLPRDAVGRIHGTICVVCKKKAGDECRQVPRNSYCDSCGEYLKAYTCHICDLSSSDYCSDCGKISGNGTNGTCAQWLMGAVDCPNCGVHVQPRTCHTCSESFKVIYCTRCGKVSGDGTNGTCLSYWTGGNHNCPHCGTVIPVKTCHTCNR